MIYLEPPFYIIEGVSILRDHIDPLQFYYLPMAPRLTRITDQTTGQHIPSIEVIKFRGDAGNGGFLNFDVNIGVDQDKLDIIRDEIRSKERLRDTPRLSPVPVIDGSVRMMLFGMQTGDKPEIDPAKIKFVTKIDQGSKPSLYGDNQAAFSVSMDQYGVTVLEKAIQGELSPIGIVYSLDYLALRPAYSIKLNVDWDRVQKHMSEKFSFDSPIFSTDIEKVVDELIENRSIELEVDTFVPEGEDTSGIISRRDQAVNEVREMITNAFFQPSLEPMKEDDWDKRAVEDVKSLIFIKPTSMFNYKKVDMTRIDKKTLNVNIRERTTVRRSIYPQGHLSGIFRDLINEGLDLNRFIIPVDLNDAYFARRKVEVISRASFEEDSILSINAKLRYNDEPKNVVLESSTARQSLEWLSLVENEKMKRELNAKYKVTFKGVDSSERPADMESPDLVLTDDVFEINPRELYSIDQIPIIAINFPWQHYPNVEVHTQYDDINNGIAIKDIFLLNKDQQQKTWKIFILNPKKKNFQYKIVYHGADDKDVETRWIDTLEEQITIRDPYPPKRVLEIVPNLNWAEVNMAFIDLSYEDKANNIFEEGSFEFSKDDQAPKKFTVDLPDPNNRMIAYKTTILFKDGRSLEVPNSFTLDRRIFIRSDMKGHKIIIVRPEKVDFALKKIKEIVVEIRYEDSAAGLSYNDIFTFKSSEDKESYFEFDYADELKEKYEYRITYNYTNGMSLTKDWEKTGKNEIIIQVE